MQVSKRRSAGVAIACGAVAIAAWHHAAGAAPQPVSSGAARDTDVTIAFAGSTAGGRRTATVSFTGGGGTCKLQTIVFEPPAVATPDGIVFPDGLMRFAAAQCAAASTLRFTLSFSTPLPAGARYWNYGPTSRDRTSHWYELPASVKGNTVTFEITDGGIGDDDLSANGTIVASNGVGIGTVPPPATPEGLIATPGNGHIALRWKTAAAATGYTVRRATQRGGPYVDISANQTSTSFTDNNRKNGTTYWYTVAATNSGGESANATEIYAIAIAPKTPTACGVEPATFPRTIRCPPTMAGTIIEEEVYVCQGTQWKSTGWRVKESACEPLDLGSTPITEF